MAVPYTFGTATAAIPLSQLDSNFATAITIGNTAVQLGNTVTTLNNMTLANVTISSGTVTITNVAVTTANVSGTANISTLVVVGNETVGGNTTITGNITAANANVTTNLVLSGGTASGVAYLNGSKVLTTGSALTFDGTVLTLGTSSALPITGSKFSIGNDANSALRLAISNQNAGASALVGIDFEPAGGGWKIDVPSDTSGFVPPMYFKAGASTNVTFAYGGNVGIGTSSPAQKFVVSNGGAAGVEVSPTGGSQGGTYLQSYNRSGAAFVATELIASKIGFYTGTSPTLSALLDSSGNLGLGTTTPTSTYSARLASLAAAGTTALALDAPTGTNTSINWYYNGTAKWSTQVLTTGEYRWYDFVAGSTRMTLDTSGNLGLGVTPSAWGTLSKAMELGSYAAISGNSSTGGAYLSNNAYLSTNNDTTGWLYRTSNGATLYKQGLGTHTWYMAPSGTAGNAITFRTSLTLSGNISGSNVYPSLQVNSGTATELSTAKIQTIKQDNNTTTSNIFVQFLINDGANGCGQITANGANTAAFGSYSDERLKENVVDLEPQLANIMSLRAVEFDYIESEGGGHQVGFIAQNMEQIYPDVVGEREDGMKMIAGWSKTEARLVKAIQEQQAIIQSLTARITALEGA